MKASHNSLRFAIAVVINTRIPKKPLKMSNMRKSYNSIIALAHKAYANQILMNQSICFSDGEF